MLIKRRGYHIESRKPAGLASLVYRVAIIPIARLKISPRADVCSWFPAPVDNSTAGFEPVVVAVAAAVEE